MNLSPPSVYAQVQVQAQISTPTIATAAGKSADATPPIINSALDSTLFFNILLGELSLQDNEPRAAFALILDSARRTKDEALFQRAVNIALRARTGDLALIAARAWRTTLPESVEAARFVLRILIALNRTDAQAKALDDYLKLVYANPDADPTAFDANITAVVDLFALASDKAGAAHLLERVLTSYTQNPTTAFSTWITLGRVRLATNDLTGVLAAAREAQTLRPTAPEPALLALAVMKPSQPAAETMVKQFLSNAESKTKPEVGLLYARSLLATERVAEALAQTIKITQDAPDYAMGWFVLGNLQFSLNKNAEAQTSLKKFTELAENLKEKSTNKSPKDSAIANLPRAYLLLSQIAENNKDLDAATAWLSKINTSDDTFAVQNRRAHLLAKQGKLDAALKILQDLPEDSDEKARLKLTAQADLLRSNKLYQRAYDLLSQATADMEKETPKPAALVDFYYDLAMMAEKLNKLDEMERLLRQVITAKPSHQHAYNALGFSLAERNVRLPEAKILIQQAVQLAPNDPFIADSLGWVEFRLGNVVEAERILTMAFKTKPDAEIAAHLGEVLWSQGKKKDALAMWKTAQGLNASNETLVETLRRLGVKP